MAQSSGASLTPAVRKQMEEGFGADFAGVRVHTGPDADEANRAVSARAFTHGADIYLARGESPSDARLMGHELAHTLQQDQAGVLRRVCVPTPLPPVSEPVGAALPFRYVAAERCLQTQYAATHPAKPSISLSFNLDWLYIAGGTANEKAALACLRGSATPGAGPNFTGKSGMFAGEPDIWDFANQTMYEITTRSGAAFRRAKLGREIAQANAITAGFDCGGLLFDRGTWAPPTPLRLDDGLYITTINDSGVLIYTVIKDTSEEQKDKKPKDKEPKKEGGPGKTLPEQLLKLGEFLAPALAAAGLLDTALAIAGVMGTLVTSPLVALAALVLGIVYFWDKLKCLGSKVAELSRRVWDKIAGLVEWVWDGFTWILGRLQELGIKLAELGSWLAGKIAYLAEQLAEGLTWVAGKIAAGGRWLGHKIASAAEAVWDWLFGSDPEPMVPIIEMPVTEEITHCATVAHEDTIVKLDADLLFPFNEWELEEGADDPLKEAAAKIGAMLQKDDWIKFEGYTDNIGSDEYNQHLSEQRAEAVRSWFVKHGVVSMSRTGIEGYGKTRAQYNDPEGRKKDRRVDIWLPKHGSVEKVCW
jgi:outer membrane protein OmpA-like peptidoglycan-associated protein